MTNPQKRQWRKASLSTGTGSDCVELADLGALVGLRDSKNPDGGHLAVSRATLRVLLTDIKAGQLG